MSVLLYKMPVTVPEFWEEVRAIWEAEELRFPFEAVERTRDKYGIPQVRVVSIWVPFHMRCWYAHEMDTNKLYREDKEALLALVEVHVSELRSG